MDSGDPLSTLLPDSDKSNNHPFPKVEHGGQHAHLSTIFSPMLSVKLGLHLPNPAPEIEPADSQTAQPAPVPTVAHPNAPPAIEANLPPEPKKKKYAKEAWPGKKPVPSLLM